MVSEVHEDNLVNIELKHYPFYISQVYIYHTSYQSGCTIKTYFFFTLERVFWICLQVL